MNQESNDITALLDKNQCCCLNESVNRQVIQLFEECDTSLKSLEDDQLIIQLAFMEPVRLSGVELELPGNNKNPKILKMFANVSNLGFSEAEEIKPTESFIISKLTKKYKAKMTHYGAWNVVDFVTLFVENNHGDKITEINKLRIFGKQLHVMKVEQIRSGCCC